MNLIRRFLLHPTLEASPLNKRIPRIQPCQILSFYRAVSKKVELFRVGDRIMADVDVLFRLTIPVLALALVSISTPILFLNGYSLIDSLFEVTSAFATAGLSVGIVSECFHALRTEVVANHSDGPWKN